jgi:hypothetical protein
MFCSNCGKEINDNAVVCIGCGCAVKPKNAEINVELGGRKAGWYFGLLLGWIGLIIIVCINSGKTKESEKFATGGCIAWCIVDIVLGVIYIIQIMNTTGSMPY